MPSARVIKSAAIAPAAAAIALAGAAFLAAGPAWAADGAADFSGHSLPMVMALSFLMGLLLNATPCVYPVIPITISYFGARDSGGRGGAVLAALLYWAGITAMYSTLGTVAALTGGMIGQALSYTPVIIILSAILVALALSMFGLWEVRMPTGLTRVAAKNRAGLSGSFFMGLFSGVLAAPCAGPVVAGLMGHVAEVGSPVYGLAVFVALSLGLGLPLALVALFSERIAALLPRAGDWMIWVRKLFGFLLLAAAAYVAMPLMGQDAGRWLLAMIIAAGAVYLGFVHKGGARFFVFFKKAFGVAALVAAALVVWLLQAPATHVAWEKFTMHAVRQAINEHRPMAVKFTADWCAYCKDLQRVTFSDPRVIKALGPYKTLVIDLTAGTPKERRIARQMGVTGLPTLVFLDGAGGMMREATLAGYEGPDEFLQRMKMVDVVLRQNGADRAKPAIIGQSDEE